MDNYINSLSKFGTKLEDRNQRVKFPKLKTRYRVIFEGFAAPIGGEDITMDMKTFTTPKGKFEDKIKILISDSLLKNYSWEFDVKGNATFLNRVSELTESESFSDLSLFSANFQYISAARNLESVFPDDYAVTIEKQISQKEGKGELTAQFLYQWGVKQKIQVHSELIHDSEYDSENNSLLDQVSAW